MRISRAVLPELSWRNAIIALLLLSLLVPVIVGTGFFFPYVVPRNIFFRVVVELGVAALVLAVCFSGKTLDLRDEPIFWALLGFVAASLVSALFSPATMHSLFGDFERMGGVWAWLHLLLFFLLLRTLRDEDWPWVLNGALIVSLVVSVAAIIEHTGFSTAASGDQLVVPSGATIGNPGLLAAYLLLSIAIAAYLATTSVRYRLLYIAAALIDVLGMIFGENRSSVIGLVIAIALAAIIYATLTASRRVRILLPSIAIAFGVIVFGSALIVRKFPASAFSQHVPIVLGRLAATNPAGSDRSRTMQWSAAVAGFKDRPIVGYGPENHNLIWSAHFDPDIYSIDTQIYDRTHNQYLEVLATGGLLGIFAFAAVWIAIGVTIGRAYRSGRLTPAAFAVLCSIQFAYATYLAFWFFDLNSTMLWILLAALIASRGTVGSIVIEPTHEGRVPVAKPALAMAVFAILVTAL
ncbi:MAG TPA: O-antigen ligase family protein, partial [Gemmatimonadaceae bacterium]|nr:O-antigen ligase family protein [Gemmatimonadaceae bacterium]